MCFEKVLFNHHLLHVGVRYAQEGRGTMRLEEGLSEVSILQAITGGIAMRGIDCVVDEMVRFARKNFHRNMIRRLRPWDWDCTTVYFFFNLAIPQRLG